ncbi:MAG: phytanoyl-CoA dioxygenase family protein [Acidimicrobiia bacterium]
MPVEGRSSRFSQDQHGLFKTVGFVRLEGAVSPSDVQEMRARAWALLEQQGFAEMDRSTWKPGPVGKLRDLRSGEQALDENPTVRAALDVVFGQGQWVPPSDWGQPLVTFPNVNGRWLMPSSVWHFDHHYLRPGEITGVNVFLFISDVDPAGGGTVVVKSSPLLADRMHEQGPSIEKLSDQNGQFLGSHPWLQGLKTKKSDRSVERNQRYMDHDTDIDGIAARVVELTGKAGDVIVCHPAMFHAPAMNVSDEPRLMRTARVMSTAMFAAHRDHSMGHSAGDSPPA